MAQSLRTNLVIAVAIGLLISTIFMAIPSMRNGTSDWAGLGFPGMVAAYVFWGAVSRSVFLGTVLFWAVNVIAYGLPAFVALSVFSALKKLADR